MRQLEDPEAAGRGDVRPAAEVDELPLSVAGDAFVGKLPRDLHLQGIVLPLEDRDGFRDRHLEAGDLEVLPDDAAHLRLDLLQVLGCEGTLRQEVVVVAVLDGRADPDLNVGKEPLHGLRGQVGRRVAVDRNDVRRPPGDDRKCCVGVERSH